MEKRPKLWDEYAGAHLDDPRLIKRLSRLVGALEDEPAQSFPQAAGDEAGREGAYRFLNNDKVTLDGLLAGHFEQTLERIRARSEAVLVVHDTTEFRFGGLSEREGLGATAGAGGRGFLGHFALAVSADGGREPLGLLDVETWTRPAPKGKRTSAQRRRETGLESERWLRQSLSVRERAPDLPLIHVEDREGDVYGSFAGRLEQGMRFVVRARRQRAVLDAAGGRVSLLAHLRAQPVRMVREVALSPRRAGGRTPAGSLGKTSRTGRPTRAGRAAKLAITAAPIGLTRPPQWSEEWPATLPLNAVLVEERGAPADAEAVEWLLLTTESIGTEAELAFVLDAYRARWTIEEYFKALKSGCALEARQLESYEALRRALGLLAPMAWQLLRLRHREREAPQTPAEQMLAPEELEVLRAQALVGEQPTVAEALRAVARLGGHIKNNGPPGWQVLWRGLRKLRQMAEGWKLAKRCDQS